MRRTRIGTGVAALVVTVSATVALEIPASASPGAGRSAHAATAAASPPELSASSVKVKSTKRVPLAISLTSELGGSRSVDVGLTRTSTRGEEEHFWFFRLGKSQANWSASKGKGSIKTGTSLRKFGRLTLSLRRAAKTHVRHCSAGGSVSETPVSVTGLVDFNTGSRAWGSVKQRHLRFGKHSMVSVDHGCQVNPVTQSCVKMTTYNIFSGNFTSSVDGSGNELFAFRAVAIKTPKNASRTDFANVPTKQVSLNTAKGELKVDTQPATLATGGAKLTSTSPPSTDQQPCRHKGQQFTEKVTNWFGTKYQPMGGPLTVHFAVGGVLKLGSSSSSSFSRETYS